MSYDFSSSFIFPTKNGKNKYSTAVVIRLMNYSKIFRDTFLIHLKKRGNQEKNKCEN